MTPLLRLRFGCGAVCAAGLIMLLAGCSQRASISTNGPARPWRAFVGDLTNLSRVAAADIGGTRLISTYDRNGGNDDFNTFAGPGTEKGWVTLVDLKGPGVIRRFWTTGVDWGHPVRLYFDGESKPRVEGRIEDVFGHREPFDAPIASYLNLCWYSYVPLTYQKSLRIEMPAPPTHRFWGPRRLFFQANVEDLPAGSAVETFPARLTDQDRQAVRAVAAAFSNAVNDLVPGPATAEEKRSVATGASVSLLKVDGPGCIDQLRLRIADPSGSDLPADLPDLLQRVQLRVTYDGAAKPSIAIPLGDFFLQHARRRTLGSLPIASGSSGLVSRLPMPFAKSVSIDLENATGRDLQVGVSADVAQGPQQGRRYLHAFWSQTGPEPGVPHEFAQISGSGHLAGISLQVTGQEDSWWILEGDEEFFVDGEQKPSWHGTGLEDYFNGGWYWRGAASAGLHGIFDRAPFRVSTYRFQTVDPVQFKSSLRCRIERGDQNVSRGFFRSTTYVYLDRPVEAPALPENPGALELPYLRQTFMLQLTELERMNGFADAIALIDEYTRRFPDAAENGLYALRRLEYRHLLGETVSEQEYQPFLSGAKGPEAAEQAKLLTWFHAAKNRALVGMNVNGKGRLFLDGKALLEGDHPFHLFVTGVELGDGPHVLAADVTATRPEPWVLLTVRTADGTYGTGPGTRSTRAPAADWMATTSAQTNWIAATIPDALRGTPDAPMIGGVPNAFVLLGSQGYGIRTPDWGYYRGRACFRVDFTTPLRGAPDYKPAFTGLAR